MNAEEIKQLFLTLRSKYFPELDSQWRVEITDDEGYCDRDNFIIEIKENSEHHDPDVVCDLQIRVHVS